MADSFVSRFGCYTIIRDTTPSDPTHSLDLVLHCAQPKTSERARCSPAFSRSC